MKATFPYIFALQGRSARKYKAEVLVFWKDKMELMYRAEVKMQWPYQQLDQLQFLPGKKSHGISSLLWGGFRKKGEDQWQWQVEEQSFLVKLEVDSRFRRNEIESLCHFLGESGIPFKSNLP